MTETTGADSWGEPTIPHPDELEFVGWGRPPLLDAVGVVVMVCESCEDYTGWTTSEQFNAARADERVYVDHDGNLSAGAGWRCPNCNRRNYHDIALASGWIEDGSMVNSQPDTALLADD